MLAQYDEKDGFSFGGQIKISDDVEKALAQLEPGMLKTTTNVEGLAMALGTSDQKFINFCTDLKNGNITFKEGQTYLQAYQETPSAISIATATWSNTGAYITLPVGKYLLIGTVAFTSNKAGRVGVRITEGGNVVPQATTLIPGLSGSSANLTVQVQWVFNVTENTTYRLQAFQTSGGNLSVTGYFKSVCLS